MWRNNTALGAALRAAAWGRKPRLEDDGFQRCSALFALRIPAPPALSRGCILEQGLLCPFFSPKKPEKSRKIEFTEPGHDFEFFPFRHAKILQVNSHDARSEGFECPLEKIGLAFLEPFSGNQINRIEDDPQGRRIDAVDHGLGPLDAGNCMLIGHRFYGDNGATAFGDSDKTFNGTAERSKALSPRVRIHEQSGWTVSFTRNNRHPGKQMLFESLSSLRTSYP
jgi:hypothetical protein